MNMSDIAILNIKGSDYCCIISLISKNEAINLMQNADLTLEHYKSKHIKKFESICKNGIKKQKFHQYKKPISIKNIDITKIVVSNKVYLIVVSNKLSNKVKKGFKYLIGYKDAKKLDLYVNFF